MKMNIAADTCRVCLGVGAKFTMFNEDSIVQLFEKIMACTTVEISLEDGLPSHLCMTCIQNLNISFNFKHLCESSDIKLRQIQSQQIKNENKDDTYKQPILPTFMSIKDEPPIWLTGLEFTGQEQAEEVKSENEFSDRLEDLIKYVPDHPISKLKKNVRKRKKNNLQEQVEDDMSDRIEDIIDQDANHTITKFKKTFKRMKINAYPKSVVYKCIRCNQTLKTQKALSRHEVKCSNGTSRITCQICNKIFKDKYVLSRHETLHKGEKPQKPKRHMCDMCGGTFHDQYGLNMHKRSHSGSRPFTCNICGNGFSQQSNMERHVKAKHEKERPFQCEVCSKVFAYSYVLTEHLKTHTGEKDFECGVCGRKFAKKFALGRHMLTHTLERPYKCLLCERAYAQSNDLKAHVRRAHER